MSDIDINRVLQNIKELQDQNAIDFQQWKRLGQEIKRLEGKIKTSDTHLNLLMKKIKSDYESLRKIIVDENVSIQLNNKIDENKKEINKKVDNETFYNSLNKVNKQIDTKADKVDLNTLESNEIKRYDMVIVTTDDDNSNLFIGDVCNTIYEVPKIYIRLNDSDKVKLLVDSKIKAICPFLLSVEKFYEMYNE